jgi:hypothetical protein
MNGGRADGRAQVISDPKTLGYSSDYWKIVAVDADGNRRGAPSRYEWDDIWVELCAMIFLDGLPETQAELVQHIASWLEAKGKPVPDDSTIKKKIRPLWQRLRPTEQSKMPASA